MINYITAPTVAVAYTYLYGPWAGGGAFILVAFVQLVFGVLLYPVGLETEGGRAERHDLNREVAWLMLGAAAIGCMLASVS